ncbi:hypothetical protein BDZ89DRAFT_1067002 [Hymenopellis radicata]|nr:hypothetical protein BDZ89DRAFT_1067002 [Hymenopellis radicata]
MMHLESLIVRLRSLAKMRGDESPVDKTPPASPVAPHSPTTPTAESLIGRLKALDVSAPPPSALRVPPNTPAYPGFGKDVHDDSESS